MNIYEATKKAIAENKALYNESWNMWFLPTDTPECVWVKVENKKPCPRWQPQARDLIYEDWTVVDLPDEWNTAT